MARRHRILRLSGCALIVSACSLVNSFDELKQPTAAAGSSGGGMAGAGPTENEAGMAGEGGVSPVAGNDQGGKGGSGGREPMVGDAGAAGAPADVDAGMVLIGASIADTNPREYYLVTMSPETGVELTREPTNRVLAIAYESTRETTDIWYVFIANDSLMPNGPATLSVRQYDEASGDYEELGSLEVAAPKDPDAIVVLNQRLFYHSVIQEPGMPGKDGFTLVDTSQLDRPQLLGKAQAPDLPNLIGMIGRPNATAKGGSVTFITRNAADCVADPDADTGSELCPVKARRGVLKTENAVAFDADDANAQPIGDTRSPVAQFLPGFASGTIGSSSRDIFVFPPAANATSTVSILVPATFMEDKTFTVPFSAPRFASTTFDPCRQIVLTTQLTEGLAVAITTADDGAGTIKQTLGHAGSRILYEQYTHTVLTTYEDDSNPKLDAWTLLGTETKPELDPREDDDENPWTPEPEIVPRVVAVKTPPKLLCR